MSREPYPIMRTQRTESNRLAVEVRSKCLRINFHRRSPRASL